MNTVLRNRLFFIIVFCVIFAHIPHILRLNFIGSFMGKNLSFYPVMIGMVYTCYLAYRDRKNFQLSRGMKILLLYVGIYVGITLLSFIHGLVIYPYYDQILAGPATQIEKLPMVQHLLEKAGVAVSTTSLLKVWMFARPIKGFFLETFWYFSVPLLIYEWYKDDVQTGMRILVKAAVCAVVVVCLYGLLDMWYLSGSQIAETVLSKLNPVVHEIKENGTWWPPLLWHNQLRSLFAEPSYFGIYAAFAMPWVWYAMLHAGNTKKKLGLVVLLFVFGIELFMTRARTANALFFGKLGLLVIFTAWSRRKSFLKNTLIILSCAFISFGAAIGIGNGGFGKAGAADAYLEDNLGSLASPNARSNGARYSILKANLAIGKEHPLLGVGRSLRNAYVPASLPEEAFSNNEVSRWIQDQKDKGIMRSGFPALGEYSSRFAETGALGLIAYLVPSVLLAILLMKKLRFSDLIWEDKENIIFFSISMAGIMASGLGDSLTITCAYWILLGVGYALALKDGQKETE